MSSRRRGAGALPLWVSLAFSARFLETEGPVPYGLHVLVDFDSYPEKVKKLASPDQRWI